ncbi:MAG: ABC transporter permease [Acidobacteriia bacterium]|nr:ABC transporter permease [Terriglobia bacterium]
MRLSRLLRRNLLHYWRTNLAVVAGVATAVSVLSGALLVGQSVRDSLRRLLYERLGATEYTVSADHFFREDLAVALTSPAETKNSEESCPIIYLQGVVILEGTGTRAYDVNVYGVDERFWKLQGAAARNGPEGRTALVGLPLALRLGVHVGDGLLLRIETQPAIPRESLYGRRENVGRTVRLVCGEILSAESLGEFSLRPSQGNVFSIFVPLERLQRDLAQAAGANAILLAPKSQDLDLQKISGSLEEKFTLKDAGVMLRPLPSLTGIAVESSRILLSESIARAAFGAAADAGMKASGVFTYLANSISAGGREIPYSVITAADLGQGAMNAIRGIEGFAPQPVPVNADDSIWLNEWAWRDLGISRGDSVEVDYYLWQEKGSLATRTARFRLAGVVSMGGDVDAALAPDFPGITEARSIRAWDPPFPLDLRRVRPKDEEYWNRYRATPKAFITLARGQELWQSRFGKLSGVRIALPEGADLKSAQDRLAERLRARLDPEAAGFAVDAVKKRGLDASQGSTDFGEYFVYFSFFLIASAILLSALFFRLGVEQRVREIGTLQAMGFPTRVIQTIFLLEGAALSVGGSLLGLLGAIGYGGLLVLGLRTWWLAAVGTRRLYLHVSWADMALGAGAGILASLAIIAWTLRGLRRNSPRALLADVLESAPVKRRRTRIFVIISCVSFLGAALMLLGSASGKIPDVEGFFGSGFLLLASVLSLAALYFRRHRPSPISGHGWRSFFRLGARNAMHRPGRSLLCVALMASATFIIVSVEAFRKDPQSVSMEPASGTGGYPLLAHSALPVVYDPNSAAGREALGIPQSEVPELAQVRFVPFRERPGDDTSCLNLYAPQEPRILGAAHSFLAGGRFSFQDSTASTPEEKRNPWLLLESTPRDGAIPAIGDANTVQYILHLSVGRELTVRQSDGTPARLRLVAALRDSILQGELVISEANFLRAFPDREGYHFFLLDVAPGKAASLIQPLMEILADWGFDVESSGERLAAYHRVENTYLSTFQSLGALGLILGTAGLATVLLRNVLERRHELALLRAVGYRRQVLSAIIIAENIVLMTWGLACGTVCALLAIAPALHARGGSVPFVMGGWILIAVLTVGLASSFLAAAAAFRAPVLGALRSE